MISAKVIAHSITENGKEIITYELEFPRFILAEQNTHRGLSKNSQSSRAVPFTKALEAIKADPVYPLYYAKNKSGMQAGELMEDRDKWRCQDEWELAMEHSLDCAERLHNYGLHKQWTNRLVEPFQYIRVVCTATELDNYFWLRDDDAAQPEIQLLAQKMQEAKENSVPEYLRKGEWHTPYVLHHRDSNNVLRYVDSDLNYLDLETALKISASCCAQVSYRKLDETREKALDIYDKLFSGNKVHLSPTEHQATPIVYEINSNESFSPRTWENGITHLKKDGTLCSGNFEDWIQYRQLVDTHNYRKK